jgi:hypothetical protein
VSRQAFGGLFIRATSDDLAAAERLLAFGQALTVMVGSSRVIIAAAEICALATPLIHANQLHEAAMKLSIGLGKSTPSAV